MLLAHCRSRHTAAPAADTRQHPGRASWLQTAGSCSAATPRQEPAAKAGVEVFSHHRDARVATSEATQHGPAEMQQHVQSQHVGQNSIQHTGDVACRHCLAPQAALGTWLCVSLDPRADLLAAAEANNKTMQQQKLGAAVQTTELQATAFTAIHTRSSCSAQHNRVELSCSQEHAMSSHTQHTAHQTVETRGSLRWNSTQRRVGCRKLPHAAGWALHNSTDFQAITRPVGSHNAHCTKAWA